MNAAPAPIPPPADALEAALDAAQDADVAAGPRLSRASVPRDLLGKASVPALLRWAALDWLLIAVCWLSLALTPPWLYPAWVFLVAGRLHALGVLLHDACHLRLPRKTPAARLLELLAGYPIASTLDAMRYHHLRHHRDSGMPTDPYFKASVRNSRPMFLLMWLRSLLLVPWWTLRAPFGLLALAAPPLRNFYGRAFLQDRSGDDLTHHPELLACARAELGQFAFQAAVLAAALAWPGPVTFGYLVPAVVTGLLAGYRILLEHDYTPAADRKMTTILATTQDHHLAPWGRLFFAPHHVGHHVVHHLHPQVAFWHLPRLRAWYRQHHPSLYPPEYPKNLRREAA